MSESIKYESIKDAYNPVVYVVQEIAGTKAPRTKTAINRIEKVI